MTSLAHMAEQYEEAKLIGLFHHTRLVWPEYDITLPCQELEFQKGLSLEDSIAAYDAAFQMAPPAPRSMTKETK